jgi:hypothetical protein
MSGISISEFLLSDIAANKTPAGDVVTQPWEHLGRALHSPKGVFLSG